MRRLVCFFVGHFPRRRHGRTPSWTVPSAYYCGLCRRALSSGEMRGRV